MFFDRVYLCSGQFPSCRHLWHTVIVLKSLHQTDRKTCLGTVRANPSYLSQTSQWWQMLLLKDGELTEKCLRTQGMWSLQGTRAICLLPKWWQLHKHALFLQSVWTSGISSVRRTLNLVCTTLNCINDLVPTSQPKFRPYAPSFFQQEVECTFPHISLLKIILSLSEGRGFASMTILPHDQIILVLAPDGSLLCSTPHNVMNNSQVMCLLYLAVLIWAKSQNLDVN